MQSIIQLILRRVSAGQLELTPQLIATLKRMREAGPKRPAGDSRVVTTDAPPTPGRTSGIVGSLWEGASGAKRSQGG